MEVYMVKQCSFTMGSLLAALVFMFGGSSNADAQSRTIGKALIVYYSRTGHITTVTEQIRTQLAAQNVSIDVFEIKTVNAYPAEYQATVDQVRQERANNYRPPIVGTVPNWASYDVVFIGTPVWFQTAALPILTFLGQYDFSGKTVVPFCTYISSSIGNSAKEIAEQSTGAKVLEELGVRERDMNNVRTLVSAWLRKIGIAK
jgi:flavodoxin